MSVEAAAEAVSVRDAIEYKDHTGDCIKEVDAAIVRFMTMQRQLIAQKEYIEVAVKNASGQDNNYTDYRVNLYKHRAFIGRLQSINIIVISAGGYHSLVLNNGRVYSFGFDYYGQLGRNTPIVTHDTTPILIPDRNNIIAISAGFDHSLILDTDGKVYSFGRNNKGQLGDGKSGVLLRATEPTEITDLNKIIAISAGTRYSLVLRNDENVYSFGDNSKGQLGRETIEEGDLLVPKKIPDRNNIIAISAGAYHSLVLDKYGHVFSFGSNEYGQLGRSTAGDTHDTTPILIPDRNNIIAISAGFDHSLILDTDGKVYSFGRNNKGQLGDGKSGADLSTTEPTEIPDLNNIIAISAGTRYSLVLRNDENVYSFGFNDSGQLGLGDELDVKVPTKIDISNIIAISAGHLHSLVFGEDGKVYSFGDNDSGQLGLGNELDVTVPKELDANKWYVPGDTIFNGINDMHDALTPEDSNEIIVGYSRAIKSGGGHQTPIFNNSQILSESVATDKDPERVVLTGVNNDLEVFNGVDIMGTKQFLIGVNAILTHPNNITETLPPNIVVVSPSINDDVKWTKDSANDSTAGHIGDWGGNVCSDVSAGGTHSLVLDTDGKVYSFGGNNKGQLGLGDSVDTDQVTPKGISTFNFGNTFKIKAISAGQNHSLVLRNDGKVFSFGFNDYGQLGRSTAGDPTLTYDRTPRQIGFGIESTVISNIGSSNIIKAISAGQNHSLVLRDDGKVFSFGNSGSGGSGSGKLGRKTPSVTYDKTPKRIDTSIIDSNKIIAISAGGSHSLVLSENGTVYSFGENTFGQLGVGISGSGQHTTTPTPIPDLNNIVAISVGYNHSLVLRNDGKVFSFGFNDYRQLGRSLSDSLTYHITPTPIAGLNNIIAISAGGNHNLVLSKDGKVYSFGDNSFDQLGRSTAGDTYDRTPKLIDTSIIGSSNKIIAISAGSIHSIVIDKDGKVYSFGHNQYGKLGLDGLATNVNAKQTTPKLITKLLVLPKWSWSNTAIPMISSGDNQYNQTWSTKPWLNSEGSWAPNIGGSHGHVFTDSYVELDLSKDYTVIGLVLQGRENRIEYVKKIKVKTATNLGAEYSDVGGTNNVFNIEYTPWNSEDNTSIQVPLMFPNSVIARHVRIYPTEDNFYTKPTMRVGVMIQNKPYHAGMKQGLTTSILKGLLMQGNKNISIDDSTKAIENAIPTYGTYVSSNDPFEKIRGFGLQ